ncbi:uncharacterized protein ABDE67_005903 [Symphorus nematophorus]
MCQLMRKTDVCYTVSCSASCADSCSSASQVNCSVNCCNSTGCLDGNFESMMMTTTTVIATTPTAPPPTTTTTPVTTTAATSRPATADNLKKEDKTSKVQWTASCTTNCSAATPCKANTKPPCHLECCNATKATSCLWLNGTLNVNFATRGPHFNIELITCLLCLLAITLML